MVKISQLPFIIVIFSTYLHINAQNSYYSTYPTPKFEYPGTLVSKSDLDQVLAHIKAENYPWKNYYDKLKTDGKSNPKTYTMKGPFSRVARNDGGTGVHVNLNEWRNDMDAVYQMALMWYFTKDDTYAQKAHDIIIAWAETLTDFGGYENGLELGGRCYTWGDGISILKGTWPKWTESDNEKINNLMEVYWNGTECVGYTPGPSNKGTLSFAGGAAAASIMGDTEKIYKVIYLVQTCGAAGFNNNISSGETGESARDQGHAAGDWGNLAVVAEILWKKGIDIYSYLDNRIMATSEYHARRNTKAWIPYIPYGNTGEIFLTDGTASYYTDNGGNWNGVPFFYHLAYGAYAIRKGLQMPWTEGRGLDKVLNIGDCNFIYYKDKSYQDTTKVTILPDFQEPSESLVGANDLTDTEIGTPARTGNSSYANNIWIVNGGGNEIWTHNADQCHMVYKEIMGDFCISAKVTSVGNTHSSAKAGVMARSDLSSNASKRLWIGKTYSGKMENHLHGWKDMRGGANWESRSQNWLAPHSYWVRIKRIGDVMATYCSVDGTSWCAVGEGRYENLPDKMYVGLMVCALSSTALNTSTFSDVSITGGTGGVSRIPDAPLSILASPGNTQVPLRWLQSFGADSYTIYRSLNAEKDYKAIASAITKTSYIDTQVHDGLTYYYKVSAVNTIGESPLSIQDTVMLTSSVEASIQDEIYNIYVVKGGNALSIQGSSQDNGSYAIQETPNLENPSQQWKLTKVNGDDYTLTNMKSEKNLDVENNSITAGAKVIQSIPSSSDQSQIWTITNTGDNTFSMIGKQSKLALDVNGGSTNSGASMITWAYGGAANQRFTFTPQNPTLSLSANRLDSEAEIISYISNTKGNVILFLMRSDSPAPSTDELLNNTIIPISSKTISTLANMYLSTYFDNLELNVSYTVYGIIVNNANNISPVASVTFTTSNSVGLDNIQSNFEITISPNPIKDVVSITYPTQFNSSIKCSFIGIDGKTHLSFNNENAASGENIHTFNVSQLGIGLYLCKIQIGDKIFIKKIIVRH